MKKLFILLLLCLVYLTGCKNNTIEYDGYINDIGYYLNDEFYIEVSLKTNDKNITVCPIIKIEKEAETDIHKISEDISFSTDNVEFLNLCAKSFSEIYNNYWSFETVLESDNETDLSNGDVIIRTKLKIVEKGNYKVSLIENENKECPYSYDDSLSIDIFK